MGTSAGQIIEDADFAAIKQSSSTKPVGRLLVTGAQNIAHNVYVAINFNVEEIDTDSQHDLITNTTRVTPNVPGVYRVWGSVCFSGRADYTFVEVSIRPNGSTPIAPSTRDKPDLVSTTLEYGTTALLECDGLTDYFELVARQTNGASATSITAQSVHLTSVLEWELVRQL